MNTNSTNSLLTTSLLVASFKNSFHSNGIAAAFPKMLEKLGFLPDSVEMHQFNSIRSMSGFLGSILVSLHLGTLIDRYGRTRELLLASNVVSLLSLVAMYLLNEKSVFLLSGFLGGLTRTAEMNLSYAMIAKSLSASKIADFFALNIVVASVGGCLGALMGSWMSSNVAIKSPYLISMGISSLDFLVRLRLVCSDIVIPDSSSRSSNTIVTVWNLVLVPSLILLAMGKIIVEFCISFTWTLFGLYLTARFHADPTDIGLALLPWSLSSIIFTPIISKLHAPKYLLISLGFWLLPLSILCLHLSDSIAKITLSLPLYTLATSLYYTPMSAFMLDLVARFGYPADSVSGKLSSLDTLVVAFAQLLGSWTAGLYGESGFLVPLLVSSLLLLYAPFLYIMMMISSRRHEYMHVEEEDDDEPFSLP